MLRRIRLALSAAALLASAAPAAGSPAAIAPSRDDAEAAFEGFAADWMERLRELAQQRDQRTPTADPEASGTADRRRYGDTFRVEVRPTGNPTTPYVGLLHYTEHVYRCPTAAASQCEMASTVPVTEIFRFTDGRWSY